MQVYFKWMKILQNKNKIQQIFYDKIGRHTIKQSFVNVSIKPKRQLKEEKLTVQNWAYIFSKDTPHCFANSKRELHKFIIQTSMSWRISIQRQYLVVMTAARPRYSGWIAVRIQWMVSSQDTVDSQQSGYSGWLTVLSVSPSAHPYRAPQQSLSP